MTSTRKSAFAIDLFAGLVFIGLAVGLVWWTGNLTSGPRLVDEPQIFELNGQAEDAGMLVTWAKHVQERTFWINRFFPVYLTHKVLCAFVYGSNFVAWSVHMAVIGGLSGWFLYLAFAHMGLHRLLAIGLSMFVVLGEQSVVWWRLFNGENLALLFLSAALLGMTRGLKSEGPNVWDWVFVVGAVLASMSKESFIVVLPAICLWRFVLVSHRYRFGIDRTWRRDRILYQILGGTFIAELGFIGLVLRQTKFRYTGYDAFAFEPLISIILDTFTIARVWPMWLALGMALSVVAVAPAYGPSLLRRARRATVENGVLIVVGLLILIPQWLLYMKSGFSGHENVNMERYLIPTMIGVAVITAAFARVVWDARGTGEAPGAITVLALGAIVVGLGAHKSTVAYADGVRYAEITTTEAGYFEAIIENTDADSQISIAFTANRFRQARRLSILLSEYFGRRNLVFMPMAYGQPWDAFMDDIRANEIRYGGVFDRRVLEGSYPPDDPIHGASDAIMVIRGASVSEGVRVHGRQWFDDSCYDVAFLKSYNIAMFTRNAEQDCGTSPEDEATRSRILLETWTNENGLMSVQGYAVSNREIAKVSVSINGVDVPNVRYNLKRDNATENLPELIGFNEYQKVHARFATQYYAPPRDKPSEMTVSAFDVDGYVVQSAAFTVHDDLPTVVVSED